MEEAELTHRGGDAVHSERARERQRVDDALGDDVGDADDRRGGERGARARAAAGGDPEDVADACVARRGGRAARPLARARARRT
jgi:hypothetical protein